MGTSHNKKLWTNSKQLNNPNPTATKNKTRIRKETSKTTNIHQLKTANKSRRGRPPPPPAPHPNQYRKHKKKEFRTMTNVNITLQKQYENAIRCQKRADRAQQKAKTKYLESLITHNKKPTSTTKQNLSDAYWELEKKDRTLARIKNRIKNIETHPIDIQPGTIYRQPQPFAPIFWEVIKTGICTVTIKQIATTVEFTEIGAKTTPIPGKYINTEESTHIADARTNTIIITGESYSAIQWDKKPVLFKYQTPQHPNTKRKISER